LETFFVFEIAILVKKYEKPKNTHEAMIALSLVGEQQVEDLLRCCQPPQKSSYIYLPIALYLRNLIRELQFLQRNTT
jgi:hypothetical protein